MSADPIKSPPSVALDETRCIRTGCGGIVKATWSIEKGTVYQCDKCKGCGKGSRIVPKPTNAQFEPPWPAHETALVCIRYPYHTAHLPTKYCAIQGPHLIKDCGEFER